MSVGVDLALPHASVLCCTLLLPQSYFTCCMYLFMTDSRILLFVLCCVDGRVSFSYDAALIAESCFLCYMFLFPIERGLMFVSMLCSSDGRVWSFCLIF